MKCIFDLLLRKKHVEVLEVLQLNNYFYVKPKKGSYEMIYRAARGVYWDEDRSSLYFKGVTTRENALKIIAEAMKAEYGITLIFN